MMLPCGLVGAHHIQVSVDHHPLLLGLHDEVLGGCETLLEGGLVRLLDVHTPQPLVHVLL